MKSTRRSDQVLGGDEEGLLQFINGCEEAQNCAAWWNVFAGVKFLETDRKIIHCDMDAFYASVEQRDCPELQGKPVVVGGSPQSRSVVAAASYEARKFGIRSAMSCAQAHRLCPTAVFLRPNFQRYKEVSREVHRIFQTVTDLVEPLSLDEAYLDVTENRWGESSATKIAKQIKREIFMKTGLTASAGVGPNKFIAKVASEIRKPDGLTVVPPERVLDFLTPLSVGKMWGVGPATERRLNKMGVSTIGDLRALSPLRLRQEFGKFGPFLLDLSHGVDRRPVSIAYEPKSRGVETTFEKDVHDPEILFRILGEQAQEVALILKRIERRARTVTVKVKYSDFISITRSKTLEHAVSEEEKIKELACFLLKSGTDVGQRAIRLVGLSVSGFVPSGSPLQLSFF